MSWRGLIAPLTPQVRALVRYFLEDVPLEDISLDQLLAAIDERLFQVWVYGDYEGVLVTEIARRPLYTALLLRFGAGRFTRDWLRSGSALVIPWAKAHGCTRIEVAGRPGWGRLMGLKQLPPIYQGEI